VEVLEPVYSSEGKIASQTDKVALPSMNSWKVLVEYALSLFQGKSLWAWAIALYCWLIAFYCFGGQGIESIVLEV
jgi:hypothetical protein